jgi:hypothetical protein
MRQPGDKGAPSKTDFVESAKPGIIRRAMK